VIAVRKGVLPKILADTTIVYVGELEWWTTDAEVATFLTDISPLVLSTYTTLGVAILKAGTKVQSFRGQRSEQT